MVLVVGYNFYFKPSINAVIILGRPLKDATSLKGNFSTISGLNIRYIIKLESIPSTKLLLANLFIYSRPGIFYLYLF